MTEPTEQVADSADGSGSGSTADSRLAGVDGERLLGRLRFAVYLLGSLLATSLLIVGTVAVIAEIKGTWHWAIHLESTISFMAIAIAVVLAALVPLLVALVVGRWWVHA